MRVRLELYPRNLPKDIDLAVPLGKQLFKPGVLALELMQVAHIGRLQRAVALALTVDRLLADSVLLDRLYHRPGSATDATTRACCAGPSSAPCPLSAPIAGQSTASKRLWPPTS